MKRQLSHARDVRVSRVVRFVRFGDLARKSVAAAGVVAVALAMAASGGGAAGCGHAQSRNDWRNPPKPCSSDADCGGEKCRIEVGAAAGTCPRGGRLPPLPPPGGPDGGGAPSGPARPDIQPSSSDIKI